MKITSASSIALDKPMRWYAEKPFAYHAREGYQKRMTIGIVIGISLYAILLLSYFLSEALHPTDNAMPVPRRPLVEINVDQIPPPPMTDIKDNNAPHAINVIEVSDGLKAFAKSETNVSTASERAAIQTASGIAVGDALKAALSSISEESGIPTPTEGSTHNGSGVIASLGTGSSLSLVTSPKSGNGMSDNGSPMGSTNQGTEGIGLAKHESGLTGRHARQIAIGTRTAGIAFRKPEGITTGGRSIEDILKTVQSNQKAVNDRYNYAKQRGGDLKGSVKIKLLIASDGIVQDATIVQKSFSEATFERDLIAVMRRMKFSPISTALTQSVTIPYDFNESE
jgi:TonB family protein